jgi:hypothetical protein
MKLLIYYTIISAAGFAAAAFLCLAIEKAVPWISMPIFLTLFFAILWAAWLVAVRLTEPKHAPTTGVTGDQRA